MLHRFFASDDLFENVEVRVEGEEGRHAVRVSRVRPGEQIELIGPGSEVFECEVLEVDRDALIAKALRPVPSRESDVDLTLALALIKPDLFELALQKGTELGVSRFVPLLSDNVEYRVERIASKGERWERIVREAVKQSGRSRIPIISEPTDLTDLSGAVRNIVVLDAKGSGEVERVEEELTICVGPEGGWSERELDWFEREGLTRVALGPRRLRAETAAIAGCVWALSGRTG